MERKNITIREDQSEWIKKQGINLSQLVQKTIDEEMNPTKEELAAAYQENASHAADVNDEWSSVSREANEHLGDAPSNE